VLHEIFLALKAVADEAVAIDALEFICLQLGAQVDEMNPSLLLDWIFIDGRHDAFTLQVFT